MKIYLDLETYSITKIDADVIYQGDIFSDEFELLFANYGNSSWFPTMSQLAPNGREAGDFSADALGNGETREYTEDGVTYYRYVFTINNNWVLMKGRSNFFIWVNSTNPTKRKCIGKVNVMLNESSDNYFIQDPNFNPAVKTYIDSEVANLEGGPKVFDSVANLTNTTLYPTNEGIALATDTGYIYYFNNDFGQYVNSFVKYNDLSIKANTDGSNVTDFAVGNDLSVGRDITASGDLSVSGDSTLTGTLNVGNGVTTNSLIVNNSATFNGTSEFNGESTFYDDIAVNSSDIVQTNGSFTTNGTITGEDIVANGDVTVSGTITATGDITANSNVNVENNLGVTGNYSSAGKIDIAGNIITSSEVQATGNIRTSSNIIVSGDVQCSSDIECHNLDVFSNITADGNVEAQSFSINGTDLETTLTGIQGRVSTNENNITSLQTQITTNANEISTLKSVQNVVDTVATYADLTALSTTNILSNDKVQVIADENHDSATTIYNWNGSSWVYVGAYGGNSYTKTETNTLLAEKADLDNVTQSIHAKKFEADTSEDTRYPYTSYGIGTLINKTSRYNMMTITLPESEDGEDTCTLATTDDVTELQADVTILDTRVTTQEDYKKVANAFDTLADFTSTLYTNLYGFEDKVLVANDSNYSGASTLYKAGGNYIDFKKGDTIKSIIVLFADGKTLNGAFFPVIGDVLDSAENYINGTSNVTINYPFANCTDNSDITIASVKGSSDTTTCTPTGGFVFSGTTSVYSGLGCVMYSFEIASASRYTFNADTRAYVSIYNTLGDVFATDYTGLTLDVEYPILMVIERDGEDIQIPLSKSAYEYYATLESANLTRISTLESSLSTAQEQIADLERETENLKQASLGNIMQSASYSGTAYEYTLDSDTLPNGYLLKIGGMSYKTTNLLDMTSVSDTTINDVTYTVNSDYSVTLSGTSSARSQLSIGTISLTAGTYTIANLGNRSSNIDIFAVYTISGTTTYVDLNNQTNNYKSFTLSEVTSVEVKIDVKQAGVDTSGYIIKPMLVSGSTAPTEYKPYFSGIRDTAPTSVTIKDSNAVTLSTKSIPASVQALSGYGVGFDSDNCNYIDTQTNTFEGNCYHIADLSQVENAVYVDSTSSGGLHWVNFTSILLKSDNSVIATIDYKSSADSGWASTTNTLAVSTLSGVKILRYYTSASTLAEALTELSGVEVVYASTTTFSTDISSYLDADFDLLTNLEGNGTLVFDNTYGQEAFYEIFTYEKL